MLILGLNFVLIFSISNCLKKIFLGYSDARDGVLLSSFDDLALYCSNFSNELATEKEIIVTLNSEKSFEINRECKFETGETWTFQPEDTPGTSASVFMKAPRAQLKFFNASVRFKSINFILSPNFDSLLWFCAIFYAKQASYIKYIDCSFTADEISLSQFMFESLDSYLIFENSQIKNIYVKQGTSILFLGGNCALMITNFTITQCSFNQTALVIANDARDITILGVEINSVEVQLKFYNFLSFNRIKQLHLAKLLIVNCTFLSGDSDIISVNVEGELGFAGVSELTLENNTLNISSNNFFTIYSKNTVDSFKFYSLKIKNNLNSNIYFSVGDAFEITLEDSILTNNTGAVIALITNIYKLYFSNFQCMNNNKGSAYNEGLENFKPSTPCGSCVYLIDTVNMIFNNISIKNNFGINTTPGIAIITETSELTNIKFAKSIFFNNKLFYNDQGAFSTCLYVSSIRAYFSIENCIFEKNTMNSTRKVFQQIGGPCATHKSIQSDMYVSDSLFIENESKYHSTCLVLVGTKVILERSQFTRNKIIFDTVDYQSFQMIRKIHAFVNKLAESNKGCLFVSANLVKINDCGFLSNSNFRGNVIIDGLGGNNVYNYLIIENSNFIDNIAANGNSAFAGPLLNSYEFNFIKCLFSLNRASGQAVILTFKPNLFSLYVVKDCVFFRNYGEFTAVASFEYSDKVLVFNNIFFENAAKSLGSEYPASISTISVISSGKTIALFRGNIYQNNWSLVRSCMVCFGSYCEYNNETFLKNEALDFAGLYASTSAFMVVTNSTFYGCKAINNGGCIANSFSKMYVYDSIFIGCEAGSKGGMLFGSESLEFSLKACTISRSRAYTGSVVSAYLNNNFNGTWLVSDSVFINNTSSNELFQISETIIIMVNSVISQEKNNVFYIGESEASFINTTFTNISCDWNLFGCALSVLKSKILVGNSLFRDITNKVEASGLICLMSDVTIEDSMFYNLTTTMEIAALLADEFSKILVRGNLFFRYSKVGAYFANSWATLVNNSFENVNGSQSNSTIYSLSCKELNISFCIFKNNRGKIGGALYILCLEDYKSEKPNIRITNSKFLNNIAESGGAIFIQASKANFSDNRFEKNMAINDGGAIYFLNLENIKDNSYLAIFNNEFVLNEAKSGPVMKWMVVQPIFYHNIITQGELDPVKANNNSLVSFPVKLKVVVRENSASKVNISLLKQISPGSPLKFQFQLLVLDTYEEVFLESSNPKFTIHFRSYPTISFKSDWDSILFGESTIRSNRGIIDLSNISLYGKEDTMHYLFFGYDDIKEFYSDYIVEETILYDSPAHINYDGEYFLRIPIKFDKCQVGEVFIETSLSCKPCPPGRYSFYSSIDCAKCPEGATCPGGANITVKKGFWRRNKYSNTVLNCEEYSDYCLEADVYRCTKGYKGPICGSCEFNYARNNLDGCTFCEEPVIVTFLKIFVYILGTTLLSILMIRSALKDSTMKKTALENASHMSSLGDHKTFQTSVIKNMNFDQPQILSPIHPSKHLTDHKGGYYKIFINFIQLVGIVRSFKVSWPSYLTRYMGVLKYLSLFSTKLLTLGCLSTESISLPFAFVEVLVMNLVFILFISFMSLFWLIRGKKKNIKVGRRIFIGFLIIYDLFQPTLVSEIANLLICKEIEKLYFLTQDTSVSCDSSQYNILGYGIFLPLLMVWALVLPSYLLFQLRKRAHRLFEASVFSVYGVYYSCYKPKYYFWDFFIMARENLIIFISLLRVQIKVRINLTLVLLCIFTYFQITRRPYIIPKMNTLERNALFISLYMIFLAYGQVLGTDEIYVVIGTIIMIVMIQIYLVLWLKQYVIFLKQDIGAFITKNSNFFKELIRRNKSDQQKSTILVSNRSSVK